MYVCMYICMYVCIYVRTYVCMYIWKKDLLNELLFSWIVYIFVCMYVCMYVCMHVCTSFACSSAIIRSASAFTLPVALWFTWKLQRWTFDYIYIHTYIRSNQTWFGWRCLPAAARPMLSSPPARPSAFSLGQTLHMYVCMYVLLLSIYYVWV
jgi:hypothetical protein